MKTTTCASAIMAGCLVLMAGAMCLAAEAGEKPLTDPQVAEVGINKNSTHLRGWMASIKPAAGKTEPAQQESGYWKQTVRRQDRGHMQE